ncbi:MAG: hypothetical protein ACR2HN_01650 [Tepidiformaceae bacterium]
MGGRRIPLEAALSGFMGRAAGCIFAATAIAIAACTNGNGDTTPPPSPSSSAPSATATAIATPAPTPTPSPLVTRPRSAAAALQALTVVLSGAGPGCSERVIEAWRGTCAEGDVDADGLADHAYLVPLEGAPPDARPAAILVRLSSVGRVESLTPTGDADATGNALVFFAIEERTGRGGADVIFLGATCGPADCAYSAHVRAWAAGSWSEAGPNASIDNLERASWAGSGVDSRLTLRGGSLRAVAAGPTRSVTSTYALSSGRYTLVATAVAPPAYLYHAIASADAIFAAGNFRASIAAYRAAVESTNLKDWRAENGAEPGRPALLGYALFRIAIASAASGEDPTEALDAAIRNSEEPLFVNAAEAFRKGFQERGGARGGCVVVTAYLATSALPEYVQAMFDYGYANHPIKTYREICPL